MNIRVIVVATSAISRSGLAAMIAANPEMTLIGDVNDLEKLARAVDRSPPDVILLDVGKVPPTSVWERLAAMQDVRERAIPIALVDDFERVDLHLALRVGVRGILSDTCSEAELIAGVSAVALGLVVFDPSAIDSFMRTATALTEPLLGRIGDRPEIDRLEVNLTSREIEVLGRLGSGLGNKAIAQGLQISEHTVKFHISAIFQKLGVSTRTEAVAMGIRLGVILL